MELATYLKINPADSVVVCLQPKKKGEIITVDGKSVVLNQDTPAGHKVLIKDVQKGEDIIKYGYPIGHAQQDMKAGDWVNENNLKTNLSGTLEYTYNPVGEEAERLRAERERQLAEERKNLEMLEGIEAIPPRPEEMDLPFGMPEEKPIIPSKTVEFTFWFEGTPSEIAHLEEELINIGIKNYRMTEK